MRFLYLLGFFALAAPLAAQTGRMLSGDPSLYYETVGERGPLVVVLHGGPGLPHDYLRPEWDRLAEGARVVYYDQRGCGRSGRTPPYGWRAHVLDLDRMLAALSPDEPVVLAGSSWGPMLALYYALAHPERVRALVLSGLTQAVTWGGKPLDSGFRARYPVARWDAVNRGLLPVTPAPVPGTMMDPRLLPRVREYCGDVHGIISMSWPDAPRFDEFKAIRVPTLVLRGGDPKNSAMDAGASLAKKLKHARVVTIPDAGHDPWLDQPAAFFEAVLAFLREVAPPARAAP